MTDFANSLAALVSKEMLDASADKAGEVIERLLDAAAFSIAIASRGDEKTADTILEGAGAYLWSGTAGKLAFAKIMSTDRKD